MWVEHGEGDRKRERPSGSEERSPAIYRGLQLLITFTHLIWTAALDFNYSDPSPNFDHSKVKSFVANNLSDFPLLPQGVKGNALPECRY